MGWVAAPTKALWGRLDFSLKEKLGRKVDTTPEIDNHFTIFSKGLVGCIKGK